MISNKLLLSTAIAWFALAGTVPVSAKDSNQPDNVSSGLVSNEKGGTYSNPVVDYDTPDPTVIKVGSTFYLFATERNHETPVWTSRDLVHWELQKNGAFLKRPTFVPKGGVWAPDVNKIGDKYVLYYAMSVWGAEWGCGVGVAVADKPEGPYVDQGKLLLSNEIGVQNSIDPFFIQEDGKNYLFWGSFHGIFCTELTDDGLHLKDPSKLTKVADNSIEGTYIYYRKGYYYLFGSNGTCCEGDKSTYRVLVGRSRSLMGPYVDKKGRKILDGHYEEVLHGNNQFAGPGHNAEIVTDDKGQDWMLYHAYVRGNADEGRQLLLDPVDWKDGWPVIKGCIPSSTCRMPSFK